MMTYRISNEQSPAAEVVSPWREEAIIAFRRGERTLALALRTDLAARIRAVTGIPVAPDSVYADGQSGIATVTVDGAIFRLAQGELVLLRPCAHCGTGQFASPAIGSVADLGRALDGWQPFHVDCEPEDPAE